MNNCLSKVDYNYYCQKYNLDLNEKQAIKHYLKKGKQNRYFANRDMEILYCKKQNFSKRINKYDALRKIRKL